MWQKLNQLDIINLEKARIQLVNVIQLVSAAARSFSPDPKNTFIDWLHLEPESESFVSNKFGENGQISALLDVGKFILSIIGTNNQKEHLVLSGMTYPMAYGWMKIKLDTFNLNGVEFNDSAAYNLEAYLKPSHEININDQYIYDHIVLYYSNADYLLNSIKEKFSLPGGVLIDPSSANMVLVSGKSEFIQIGFSLGNKSYPEPYFFVQVSESQMKKSPELSDYKGIRNSKGDEYVIMASDFLTQNQDLELQKVTEFFTYNLSKLLEN